MRKYAQENMVRLRVDPRFEQDRLKDDRQKEHKKLNFYLPHECGGFGEPFYEKHLYEKFNIYSDKMDLAIIKPKYTTKNEFKVDLPKNEFLDEPDEEDEEQ